LADGFDGNGTRALNSRVGELGGGTNVDRESVETNRWAVNAENLTGLAIKANHLGPEKPRASKLRQAAQINVHLIEGVMTRHIAWQHAGVGRVCIAANHSQANAWHGIHRKISKHTHMGVTATDEHDIAQDRLRDLFHDIPLGNPTAGAKQQRNAKRVVVYFMNKDCGVRVAFDLLDRMLVTPIRVPASVTKLNTNRSRP
jgi:hypothetical protein